MNDKYSKFQNNFAATAMLAGVAIGAAAILATDKKKRQQARNVWTLMQNYMNDWGMQIKEKAERLNTDFSNSVQSIVEGETASEERRGRPSKASL